MRIALVTPAEAGGPSHSARDLSRTLARQGHEVHMAFTGPAAPGTLEFVQRWLAYDGSGRATVRFERGVPLRGAAIVHELDPSGRPSPGAPRPALLPCVLDRVRPDIVHVEQDPGAACDPACRAAGAPLVLTPHACVLDPSLLRDAQHRHRVEAELGLFDGLVCPSVEMRNRIAWRFPRLEPLLEGRTFVVPVGVDTSRCTPRSRSDRASNMRLLRAAAAPGGKAPHQSLELRRALERGDVEAVGRYHQAYDHAQPDADLHETLASLPVDADWIVCAEELTHASGVHAVLAAFPAILAERPRAHLLIAGSGPFREALEGLVHALSTGNHALFSALALRGNELGSDGEAHGPLQDLLAYASNRDIRNLLFTAGSRLGARVRFLGHLDPARRRLLLGSASLVVCPSTAAGAVATTWCESLAFGVPALASEVGALRDGLAALQADLAAATWEHLRLPVLPDTRVLKLAENAVWILGQDAPALRAQLRTSAVQRFDWNIVARQVVEAYAAILRSGRAVPADRAAAPGAAAPRP